ncbi:aspartate aminotransferase family protein [Paenibacillus sp. Root444D2]|uniref:aspartate aminotransferase family protein n=1 Tax=Paenibacillus sp. Root444D2 TaxID=1736538 RepID=UPI00070BAFF1|nr:aspartate aminotransferase family protein [Paenibacillus sp. Root444D2]KQX48849.1 class III aminotransferase [Paenibacillus sp. Root444D2]
MKSYAQSKSHFETSSQYLAGGVASSLRAAMKPAPLFADSASGAYIRDIDGNEYVDYLLAYGPLILGHAHPELTDRIHKAMQGGFTYGLQHKGEIELAKRLVEVLPGAELAAFSGSGTEAVMLALRVAKAYTGKRKIVRFHGHYHGWSDSIFTSFPSADMKKGVGQANADSVILPGTGGQSEVCLQEVILLPWNDLQALEDLLRAHHNEIAAVITEPVMCNSGCLAPQPGYLESMRKLTEELGITLIFDEVITGFRLGLGGAHGRFGILPDLIVMGKALAGGIALSAVAGKKEWMNLITTGEVSHLGTLNGNCISTSAALAVLDVLSRDGGAVFQQMEDTAKGLVDGLRGLLQKHGIPGVVNQVGPVFHMMFVDLPEVSNFAAFSKRDAGKYATFAERMLQQGVLVRPNGLWYVSTVHREKEVNQTLHVADLVFSSL